MNIELLKKVKQAILDNPEHFDMSTFFDGCEGSNYEDDPKLLGKCGTTACIAGWAIHLSGCPITDLDFEHDLGKDLLGLTEDQAQSLFYEDGWPGAIYNEYYEALEEEDHLGMAKAAAKMIDRLIENDSTVQS